MNIINKIYKAKGTLLEMLELRNYNTNKFSNFSINEIDTMYKSMDKKTTIENSALDFTCQSNDTENDSSCIIKFLLFTKMRVGNLKILIDNMISDEIIKEKDTLIFVVKDKINTIDTFESLFNSYIDNNNIMIQIFWIDTLLFNITKHELVPEMRILNNQEKNELFEKVNIERFNQLPLIEKTDPSAKFYGLKKGDVVEIIRKSPTSGVFRTYRFCE